MEKRTPPLELIFSVLTRVDANRRVTRSEVRELHNALLSTKEELLDPSKGYGGVSESCRGQIAVIYSL